ncbi:NAD(P)H-hydrate dehydratase [Patescibacteria group bacterium]|nr:NAD(P)H-hydrate dehydratase [Patescibacteria group bacterium]
MNRAITQNEIIFPEILAPRPQTIHKKQCGQVLVIAGSKGMTGAAVLTCRAAMRAGAGVVTLAFPETLAKIYKDLLPEVMTIPCSATSESTLSYEAVPILLEKSTNFAVVVIGPGLSKNKETQKLTRALVKKLEKPLIIDADGLNALVGQAAKLLTQRRAETIITPHEGEMAGLVNKDLKSARIIKNDKVKTAREYAQKWLVNIILKGAGTVIAEPGGEVIINGSGGPALATAGTGDVLTGIISAFWAQNIKKPFRSACTAVYLHGLAGDKAAAKLGERSVIASDVIKWLPAVMKK